MPLKFIYFVSKYRDIKYYEWDHFVTVSTLQGGKFETGHCPPPQLVLIITVDCYQSNEVSLPTSLLEQVTWKPAILYRAGGL